LGSTGTVSKSAGDDDYGDGDDNYRLIRDVDASGAAGTVFPADRSVQSSSGPIRIE